MSAYANPRGRIIQLGTAAVAAAPARGQIPHFNLSARTARGLLTQGFAWTIVAPSAGSAIATSPGFTCTLWRVEPTLGQWLTLQPFTAFNYNDQLTFPDISGGMGLYFQITNVTTPGNVLIGVSELD